MYTARSKSISAVDLFSVEGLETWIHKGGIDKACRDTHETNNQAQFLERDLKNLYAV